MVWDNERSHEFWSDLLEIQVLWKRKILHVMNIKLQIKIRHEGKYLFWMCCSLFPRWSPLILTASQNILTVNIKDPELELSSEAFPEFLLLEVITSLTSNSFLFFLVALSFLTLYYSYPQTSLSSLLDYKHLKVGQCLRHL